MSMLAYNRRVQRGVKLLDEKVPGWTDRIDPAELNMQYHETCMLAQLYGSYERGLMALNLDKHKAFRCGFILNRRHWWSLFGNWFIDAMLRPRYHGLTSLWRTHLEYEQRKSAAQPALAA
jgi:hypothetical protein